MTTVSCAGTGSCLRVDLTGEDERLMTTRVGIDSIAARGCTGVGVDSIAETDARGCTVVRDGSIVL
jgi:hypothetical protein